MILEYFWYSLFFVFVGCQENMDDCVLNGNCPQKSDSGNDVDVLYIENFNLRQPPSESIRNRKSLLEITIIKSKIIELTIDSFQGLSNLRMLNLSYNELENLEEPYFADLSQLKSLNLSSNNIILVASNAFEGLKSLEYLDLSNNSIGELPVGMLKDAVDVRHVDASRNKIQQIPEKLFYNLRRLTTVDLKSNSISTLSSDLFERVPKLENLILSHNEIHTFEPETFSNGTNIKKFKLDNNLLTWIEIDSLDRHLKSLRSFTIQNNPWTCSCFNSLMTWLKRKRVGYYVKYFFDGNRPVCVFEKEILEKLEGSQLQTYSKPKCRKLRQNESKAIQNVYKKGMAKYDKYKK